MTNYPWHYILLSEKFCTLQYIVPVAVKYSYCTDDGCGKYLKHVEWSCNKTKIGTSVASCWTFYVHKVHQVIHEERHVLLAVFVTF
jgi:hypothetical protein